MNASEFELLDNWTEKIYFQTQLWKDQRSNILTSSAITAINGQWKMDNRLNKVDYNEYVSGRVYLQNPVVPSSLSPYEKTPLSHRPSRLTKPGCPIVPLALRKFIVSEMHDIAHMGGERLY